MVTALLHRSGLRSWLFHGSALTTVGVCLALWIRAKSVDQDERGNAERRALFAGLWAPTLWGIGQSLEARESGLVGSGRHGIRRPTGLRRHARRRAGARLV